MNEITLAGARGAMTALRAGNPEGAPLLALHGWLDNAASFLPLLPELAAYDLVALDLPGHGGSAHRQPGYDYVLADWIHDVLDALDALGWPRAHLLGHSMGGAIASLVAAAAPERIERLALVEALGPLAGRPEDAAERLRHAIATRRAASAPAAAGKPARVIADLEHAVDARLAVTKMERDAARLVVARNLRAVEGGYSWRSDPRLTWPAPLRIGEDVIRACLRSIAAPTLVLVAEPAPAFFSAELCASRTAELADGRLVRIPGGHHLHMEQAATVGAILREFLGQGAAG